MPANPQLSAKAQQTLGVTPGLNAWQAAPFGGINLSASRPFMSDQEFYWLENYVRAGDGYLRAVWDIGSPIYTNNDGRTILSFFWFNIGPQTYAAVFFTNGTAVQVAYPSGTVTTISAVLGTFYTSGAVYPACVQWGAQYLLIASNITQNSYWTWDGSILYARGGIGPNVTITDGGAGYSSAPTVTAFGGSGSGIVATPVVNEGSVVAVQIDDPGEDYLAGEIVQFAFSGGGSDSSAILEAVLSQGALSNLQILDGGSGYSAAPDVSFIGGGAMPTATATISGTGIASIAVNTGGTNFTSTPTVVITGDGSGATATAALSGGAVSTITVTDAGTGYTTATVSFYGGGQAVAAATTTTGVVTGLSLTNTGENFTGTPLVIFSGGGGTGAIAQAILTPGTVSSVTVVNGGSGFTGTPTLTFEGGGGSGAVATASLTGGSISSVTVTNGGANYITVPAVVIETGLNNAAAAQAELMPYGVSGAAMETFQSRVFALSPFSATNQNGGVFLISAPEDFADFATSAGGLIFTSTDRFLRAQYINIRQTNSYLYPFGDSSTSVISNIQTAGSPLSTTFNYQNVDPQIGMSWRDSCQDFGRTVLFGNELGIYGLYGGAVAKVSGKLDQLFVNAIFPPTSGALLPSSATASIFNVKHYLILLTITDPFTGLPRNVMLAWNEKDWSVISQSADLTYIGTQEVSSNLAAWGTDGKSLYPLMAKPSATLQKVIATKLYGAGREFLIKELLGVYVQGNDLSSDKAGFSGTVVMNIAGMAQQVENGESVQSGSFAGLLYQNPELPGGASYWPVFRTGNTGLYGIQMGLVLGSTSPDYALSNLVITYREFAANQ